jgi:UDP-N-acetylmuramoyl-tripeptide--D-alanyl-D-alanine ligase
VLNGDDGLLMDTARRFRQDLFTFGLGSRNDVFAEDVHDKTTDSISFILRHRDGSWPVHLKVPGRHNMQNALAAAAVGFVSGSAPEHILAGLEEFRGIKGRFTVEHLSCGITIIDDTYNANPTALQAALDTGKSMISKGGRLVVALGDMLELGEAARREHRAAGRLVAGAGAAFFVVMGTHAPDMIQGAKEAGFAEESMAAVNTHDQMVRVLRQVAREGDIVFFKASRLLELEKAVEDFKALMEQERVADAL